MFHHQKSEENIVEELQSFYSLSYAPSIISNPVNVHPSLWKAPGKRSVISPIFLYPVDVFLRVLSHPPVVSAPSFSPSSASLRICVTRVDFGGWMWGWAAGRQKSGRRRWRKGNDDIVSSEKRQKRGSRRLLEIYLNDCFLSHCFGSKSPQIPLSSTCFSRQPPAACSEIITDNATVCYLPCAKQQTDTIRHWLVNTVERLKSSIFFSGRDVTFLAWRGSVGANMAGNFRQLNRFFFD